MDHTNALNALTAKLEAIGYTDADYRVVIDDGYRVELLKVPNSDTKIEIHVTDFWAHEGESCYFVNFSNRANGNFSCCEGTNSLDRAIFDLGQCVWFANTSDYTAPTRKIELPEGVSNIFVETGRENMLGDVLVVQTMKGAEIRLNALNLGDHEVSVVVSYDCNSSGSYINADPMKPNAVGHF
jgi:hypothetical protein